MTNNDRVTIRDVYNQVAGLEKKLGERIDKVEIEVDANTTFRNQLIGKITVIVALLGIGINWLWDSLVNR
jgi:hypothetical protein